MKKFLLLLVVLLVGMAFAEQPSYTSPISRVSNTSTSVTSVYYPASYGTDALTFYTDLATFEADNPGLTSEDYSSTLVPASSVQSDTGPLDYNCNNSLFALHTLVDGMSLWEMSGNDMVVLTPDFLGVTSVSVGPNTFVDDAVFDFTVTTYAFGCFIVMPNGANPVNIEVFGPGGSIGTTSTSGATGDGAFWGVYSDSDPIVRIEFDDTNDGGELFANVQFGVPTALERSTWGSVKTLFQ